jgi:alkyldihydroxyacetonephosphate synthase
VYIGPALGSKWAANRFKGPYLRNTLWELGYSVDTIETAVDWPQVKPLMLAMEQAARDAFAPFGTPVHAFTHLSHLYPQGSSIYAQYVWPTAPGGFAPNCALAGAQKSRGRTDCRARRHREPPARRGARPCRAPGTEKGPLGMATLAGLCRQFDPHGIMNPGKLLQDGGPWRD